MKYRVDGVRVTTVEDEVLVAGSVKVHSAEFMLDSSWDSLAKTAVFKNGNVTVEKLLIDGKCEIPWEALSKAGVLLVGLRGELGETQRPTLWAQRKTVHEGADKGTASREPTPDIYGQLLSEIAKITEGRTPELKCEGKTVFWKYTDEDDAAWRELLTVITDDDRSEIVSAVLAALPNGDEVSY